MAVPGSIFGGFGSRGNFFTGPAPGFVSPFAGGQVQESLGQSLQAMTNRYNQLGLGGSTAEQMDLGQAPSVTGGIPAEFQAILGELQNANLSQSSGGGGGGGKGGGGKGGGLGSVLPMLAKGGI